jgi:hypothetical protein
MKTKTEVLKMKSGEVVATAFPWDSSGNREWQRKEWEKRTGEPMQWQPGEDAEVIRA